MTPGIPNHVREMLDDSGALLTGHFLLTSGRHSASYFQCARICAIPRHCEALARELADRIRAALGPDPFDLVIAPAIGGIVIGYEMARQFGVPGYFTERDASSIMRLRRGFEINPGQRLLLVEDVITTGGSVLEVAEIAENLGAKTVAYACLFDRSGGDFKPGPPVFSVARVSFPTYEPGECPLCREGAAPAIKPGSRR